MKKIYTARIYGGELPDEFQTYLDSLLREGKVFNIEEYYNDTMTVIVTNRNNRVQIYMYRTTEVKQRTAGAKQPHLGTTECTLSIVEDLKELRTQMIKRRVILDLDEMRQAYRVIESFIKGHTGI